MWISGQSGKVVTTFLPAENVDGDCIRYIPPKAEGRQCGNAAISVYLYAFYNTSNNMQKKKKPTSFKVDCTQSCVFLSFLQAADIIIQGVRYIVGLWESNS
jgi:hypothetical protein